MEMPPRLVTLPFKYERDWPPFETYDPKYADKFPESLARYFIKTFTGKGERVFDPFAGLGTTLFVAEELGRKAYGVEANPRRAEWVAGQLENWTGVMNGDSADMLTYPFPKMDFVLTSPPYMPCHHKWNPLFGGDPAHAGYERYLERMALIFERLAALMKRNAVVVVQADNLPGKRYTPLVRDIGNAVSRSFRPAGETIVQWKGGPENFPFTTCMIFRTVKS